MKINQKIENFIGQIYQHSTAKYNNVVWRNNESVNDKTRYIEASLLKKCLTSEMIVS